MNLEHCRKDAKRLLHGVSAGHAGTLARVRQVLGDRVEQRFGLSDAQHVVACERGYPSWPALARAVRTGAEPGLAGGAPGPDRDESVIDTGLAYGPGDPVLVWVLRRGHRLSVSDHGAAVRKAGRPPRWERACDRVLAELDVNISRAGVVSLPVVAAGPSEAAVVARIGRASLSFFEELLELERQ